MHSLTNYLSADFNMLLGGERLHNKTLPSTPGSLFSMQGGTVRYTLSVYAYEGISSHLCHYPGGSLIF